jgi:predicted transglutaminase-like protease
MIRKILKILGILVVVVLVAFITIYAVYNEKLPEGRPGSDADALAQKMLSTLNYDKFKQTRFLEWSFQGGEHQYKWDKEKRNVAVSWDEFLVNLDLIAPESSLVFKNGERLMDLESEALIEKAVDYFNND